MSLIDNFVAVIVAATTAFVPSVSDMPMTDPTPIVQDDMQTSIDNSSSEALNDSMTAGIAIVDRAKGNQMKTNGATSHLPMEMQSLGRLPILFYAVRTDKEVARGNVTEIVSMMQGSSGSATDEMWEKYGGKSIVTDIAERYNLQETKVGETWHETKMSAVDIGRMIRRFLDDDRVTTGQKQWTVSMLRNTSNSISGQDFSWGLPQAFSESENAPRDSKDNDNPFKLAWAQGWSQSGTEPMVRSSVGIVGSDMRHIVVIHGKFPSSHPDREADSSITKVSSPIADYVTGQISTGGGSDDPDAEKFREKQIKKFNDFVDDKDN